MFHVSKGKLDLTTDTVVNLARKIATEELEVMDLRKMMKFLFFVKNPDAVKNPITALAWGTELLEVHPGHYRFLAAYFSGQKYIDAIFLHSDEVTIHTHGKDIVAYEDAILLKQYGSELWQITCEDQKTYFNDEHYAIETQEYESVWKDIYERLGHIKWRLNGTGIFQTGERFTRVIKIYDPLDIYNSLVNLIKK